MMCVSHVTEIKFGANKYFFFMDIKCLEYLEYSIYSLFVICTRTKIEKKKHTKIHSEHRSYWISLQIDTL